MNLRIGNMAPTRHYEASGVPHRGASLICACRPGRGRGPDSSRHPIPTAGRRLLRAAQRPRGSCPTTPIPHKPAGHARVKCRTVDRKKGKPVRTPPRPGSPCPAGGQRADHKHLLIPPFPGVTGIGQGGPEADAGTPVWTAGGAYLGMVTAGLPRRLHCLAAAQAEQQANSHGEACAPANSRCLITCLTAPTAARGATARQTRALHSRHAPGSTPATVLVRGHYPGPLPG